MRDSKEWIYKESHHNTMHVKILSGYLLMACNQWTSPKKGKFIGVIVQQKYTIYLTLDLPQTVSYLSKDDSSKNTGHAHAEQGHTVPTPAMLACARSQTIPSLFSQSLSLDWKFCEEDDDDSPLKEYLSAFSNNIICHNSVINSWCICH